MIFHFSHTFLHGSFFHSCIPSFAKLWHTYPSMAHLYLCRALDSLTRQQWPPHLITLPILCQECSLSCWLLQGPQGWWWSCGQPPTQILGCTYALSPSPLCSDKYVHVTGGNISQIGDSILRIEHMSMHGPTLFNGPCCFEGSHHLGCPHWSTCACYKLCMHRPSEGKRWQSNPFMWKPSCFYPNYNTFFWQHFMSTHPKHLYDFALISCNCVIPSHLVIPFMNVDRPSTISLFNRHTIKAVSCDSNHYLALQRSARHSLSQMPLYSTCNSLPHNLGSSRQIWAVGSMSGLI